MTGFKIISFMAGAVNRAKIAGSVYRTEDMN